MLSLPHLIVLFTLALLVFGPQKLPELARILGKATAEFRKMTNDFRYALEDEVRELDRQNRIREEESAAAARVAQTPAPSPAVATTPEGAVPREAPNTIGAPLAEPPTESQFEPPQNVSLPASPESAPNESIAPAVTASPSHEKPSDDNSAV